MNEFSEILDDCLRRISDGRSRPEECLALYPEHARELEPLLRAAGRLERGRGILPSDSFRARTRARVMAHARAHPPRSTGGLRPAWRMAVSLTVLAIVLMLSTTAFAQAAVPGDALYGWKLSSEHVWRAVSADQLTVDLALADRRTDELAGAAHDPLLEAQALNGLHDVLARLELEDSPGNAPRIQQALEAHLKKLNAAGIHDPQLEKIVHDKPETPSAH